MKILTLLLSFGFLFTSCGKDEGPSKLWDDDTPSFPDWSSVSKVGFIGDVDAESRTMTSIILERSQDLGTYTATLHIDRIDTLSEEEVEIPQANEPEQIAQFLTCENQLSEASEDGVQILEAVHCSFDNRGAEGPLVEVNFMLNENERYYATRVVTPAELEEGMEPETRELAKNLELKIFEEAVEVAPIEE